MNHNRQPFYGPFFWDHPGEPVPEENFWTLWCKGRLTEADSVAIQLGATPSGLTSAHLHHPLFYRPDALPASFPGQPEFFTGRMLFLFLMPNQQRQSTEGHGDRSESGRCMGLENLCVKFSTCYLYHRTTYNVYLNCLNFEMVRHVNIVPCGSWSCKWVSV